MARQKKYDPDATHIGKVSPTEQLAEQFLDQLMTKAWGNTRVGQEPTIFDVESKPHQTHQQPATHYPITVRKSPFLAALFSLLIPGSGFLYVGSFFLWFFFLFLTGVSSVLFAAYTGWLPPVYDFLQPYQAHLPSAPTVVLVSGAATLLFTWLNLIIPVSLANRTQSSRFTPHVFWVFITSPLPMLGPYAAGRIFLGHFQALNIFSGIIATATSIFYWNQGGAVEMEWLVATAVALLATLGFLFGWLVSLLGAVRICGWVDDGSAQTEKKFVVLGLIVVLVIGGFAIVGKPGQLASEYVHNAAVKLEQKEFRKTSSVVVKVLNAWEKAQRKAKEVF